MSPDQSPEVVERLVWEGVAMDIRYEPDWGGMSELGAGRQIAHIEIQVLEPVGTPLPVTETGYRSHFLHHDQVEEAGGPAAFVRAWLDEDARKPAWRRVLAAWRQLDLFG